MQAIGNSVLWSLELRKWKKFHIIDPMELVKVQGMVTSSEHGELKEIATKHQTTIGRLVAQAVRALISNPKRAKELERDGRRK